MNGRIPNPGVRPLHQGPPVAHAGAVVSRANAAMILLHGRDASAEDILSLAQAFAQPEIAYFAPQAAGHSWYPHSFLAPVADNEPWLSSALQVIADILRDLARDGIPPSRVVLLGCSQGGCLALEFARRYGAVIGSSAGLIGANGTSRTYSGSLQGAERARSRRRAKLLNRARERLVRLAKKLGVNLRQSYRGSAANAQPSTVSAGKL